MKTEFLPNRGHATLQNGLSKEMENSTKFDIGSAFLTNGALDFLLDSLRNNTKQSARLLISFLNGFISPKVLRLALKAQVNLNGRLQVHVSNNLGFHWKYYHLIGNQNDVFFIGSANFTSKGLKEEGDLILRLELPLKDNFSKDLNDEFEREWKRSSLLTQEITTAYETSHIPIKKIRFRPSKKLLNLLGRPKPLQFINSRNIWRLVSLDGNISKESRKKIEEAKPVWKGKEFLCLGNNRVSYNRAKDSTHLIIAYWNGDKLQLQPARYEDFLSSIPTEDGKYFIAYKPLKRRRSWNAIPSEKKRLLSRLDLSKVNLQRDKFLDAKGLKAMLSLWNINI
jgi:HKD family nuclease